MNSDVWDKLWREQPTALSVPAGEVLKRTREETDTLERELRKGDRKILWILLVVATMANFPWRSEFDRWADWAHFGITGLCALTAIWIVAFRLVQKRSDARFDESLLGRIDRDIDRARRRLTRERTLLLITCPLVVGLFGWMFWRTWKDSPELRPLHIYFNFWVLALGIGGTWNGHRLLRESMETHIRNFAELRKKIVGESL